MQTAKVIRQRPNLRVIDCQQVDTYFAPARRASHFEIEQQHRLFASDPQFVEVLDCLPNAVMMLNRHRQIVYQNRTATALFGGATENLGKRPGEALRCVNAKRMPGGCGTSRQCSQCGAVKAIVAGTKGEEAVEDCRISVEEGTWVAGREYRANVHPYRRGDTDFVFLQLIDISDEVRRESLERIFLHDVMNSVVALRGFSELVASEDLDATTRTDFVNRIAALSDRIANEINSQRDLRAAEQGQLRLKLTSHVSTQVLEHCIADCRRMAEGSNVNLELIKASDPVPFLSDASLLGRVICNLVKNAIEASNAGDRVRIGCKTINGDLCFWVNNPAFIPEEVQLQIFNRSFSTKGTGRGLGTYSVRFLTERYLDGLVEFDSNREDGTTFVVRLKI